MAATQFASAPAPQITHNFTPRVEADGVGPTTSAYQNISFIAPHHNFSAEELRLNDYTQGHGPSVFIRPQPRAFPVPTDGLVVVGLPADFGHLHASCRAPAGLAMQLGAEIITLRVENGNDSKDFVIHRNVITRRSAFIRDALKGEWKEAQTGIISLPDDDWDIVEMYQQWLYTGCLTPIEDADSTSQTASDYTMLVKAYIFGEKFWDPTYKDCVIDAVISLLLTTRLFDPTISELVYTSTPPNSPLRKLWQDIYTFCGSVGWLDDAYAPNSDFTRDLLRKQMGFWNKVRPEDGINIITQPCAYHEHEDGKCYRVASVPVLTDWGTGGGRGVVSALWS